MLHFQRKVPGGRRAGKCSDLLVYSAKSCDRKKTLAVCLRVSANVMSQLRWRTGDYATADFEPDGCKWTLKIVSDETGNKLSGKGRPDATGTVRFAISTEMLQTLGLAESSGYSCRLVTGTHESATFSRVE